MRWTSTCSVSAASRAILPISLALPQQIIRCTPQHPAARAIRERLMLLRIGGQATISSRGRSNGQAGL